MGITKQVIQFRISWPRGIPKRPSTPAVSEPAGFWPRLATRGQVLGPLASCQAAAIKIACCRHGSWVSLSECCENLPLNKFSPQTDGWRSTKVMKTIIKSAQCMKRQVQLRMGRSVSMACSLHIKPIVDKRRQISGVIILV